MKPCGCRESCFVNGDSAWGHWGGVLCLHASERKAEPENISVCGLTKEDVTCYCSEQEYNCLTVIKED